MKQYKHTGGAALVVASLCLIAATLSLTGGGDHRATPTAESTQPQALPDTQPQELIRAVVSERIEQLWGQEARYRNHVADLRPEPTRNQQLQEYFEIRDALELRREMSEEFNRGGNWQPEVRIHIPAENTTE